LPPAAGVHHNSTSKVTVYGNDFPTVQSNHYICLYGSTATAGRYVKSTRIECEIPQAMLPGRYLFNIIPYGSDKALPFVDKRAIHFTFYVECDPSRCSGYCVGPTCICPSGRSGILCEQTNIPSSINHQTLSNTQLTKAVEGKPYNVKIPLKEETTILNLETNADGMEVSSDGMVKWLKPIGRTTPYSVNVTVASQLGESTISWNLTVEPTYSPIVIRLTNVGDTNKRAVQGIVQFIDQRNFGRVPVRLRTFRNGILFEDVAVESDSEGRFEFVHIPSDEASTYKVIASHPGEPCDSSVYLSQRIIAWSDADFDVDYEKTIKMKRGSIAEETYRLHNNGDIPLAGCWVQVITPRDKLTIDKVEQSFESIGANESKTMRVEFSAAETLDSVTATLQFSCVNSIKRLVRQTISVEESGSYLRAQPRELLFSFAPQTTPPIIRVSIGFFYIVFSGFISILTIF
uniref:IPT/TIG domain-containing protein n=1 Tax=Anisakis simplex TaxID=6269 RepID=A0A0M3J2F4_ANISI